MSNSVQDGSGVQGHSSEDTHMESPARQNKGKGIAEEPVDESEEDEDEEEEEDGEEEADEDNMEEIDEDNIVKGRTRNKNIDFAKAAAEFPAEDDDDEDDDDFQAEDDDRMEE